MQVLRPRRSDMAGLVFHAHAFGGMADRDAAVELGCAARAAASDSLSSPCRMKSHVGMALDRSRQRGHDNAGAGIAAHGIDRDGQVAGHRRLAASMRSSAGRRLALRLHDFAVVIMAAGAADMMRTLLLAAVRAVGMGGGRQGDDATGACCGATARFFVLGTAMAATPSSAPNRRRATIDLIHREPNRQALAHCHARTT